MAEKKTNAMRILDTMKIEYRFEEHEMPKEKSGHELGIQIADMLGLDHKTVYKTLVTEGNDKNYYVFVIPIEDELDLKKCAKSVGVKSVEMIRTSDIMKVTGYIRGGCTAIGMKKQYVTRISDKAEKLEEINVSGGKVGMQLTLNPNDLKKASGAEYADITR